jgi:formylglycine-generating enzyme required for sulfatase activity
MKINRLNFLRILGLGISAAVIKACSPLKDATPTSLPTDTQEPATSTPEPSPTPISHITPKMVQVEAGEFQMGSAEGAADEAPIHSVTISAPFYIGVYEVTFDEFDAFCGDIGRYNIPDDGGKGRGNRPVLGVDWDDAIEYCNWLSEKEGLTPCYSGKGKVTQCDFSASGYRLPTEGEWEFAARGGIQSKGYYFSGSDDPDQVAWYADNAAGGAHPVGEKTPNELGLYDMCGNRFEWCWDWYLEDYYSISPAMDPLGPPRLEVDSNFDLVRVRRGGSWGEDAGNIRITSRSFDSFNYPGGNGFRLVRKA